MAQLVADREAGTPGPWESKTGVKVCESEFSQWIYAHKYGCLGYWTGHKDRHEGIHSWLLTEVDARRIARLPDIEAAYLTLAAENATLRASEAAALQRAAELETALVQLRDLMCEAIEDDDGNSGCGQCENDCTGCIAAAALTRTTDKEPKT